MIRPPTITSFTQKILAKYPKTTALKVYVHEPLSVGSTYIDIRGNIANITRIVNNEEIKLTPEEFYEIFGKNTCIKLGSDTKKKQIQCKIPNLLVIYTKPKTFTTMDGKTISYYPTESTPITNKELAAKIATAARKFARELSNIQRNRDKNIQSLPKLSDLPDFDSD